MIAHVESDHLDIIQSSLLDNCVIHHTGMVEQVLVGHGLVEALGYGFDSMIFKVSSNLVIL